MAGSIEMPLGVELGLGYAVFDGLIFHGEVCVRCPGELHVVCVQIPMQDYKSMPAAVMIWEFLVNRQTHRHSQLLKCHTITGSSLPAKLKTTSSMHTCLNLCVRVSMKLRSIYSSQRRSVFRHLVATLQCGWLASNRSDSPLPFTKAVSMWPSTPLTTWHPSTGLKLRTGQHLILHLLTLSLWHMAASTIGFMHR